MLSLEDKLWMLEKLTGRNTWRGQIEAAHFGATDPGANRFWNAAHIEGAWTEFARRQATGFAVQAATRDWLKGASWSLNLDRFVATDATRLQNTLLDHLRNVTDREEAAFAALAVSRLKQDGVALDAQALRQGLAGASCRKPFRIGTDEIPRGAISKGRPGKVINSQSPRHGDISGPTCNDMVWRQAA